jgi:hypothetical protein
VIDFLTNIMFKQSWCLLGHERFEFKAGLADVHRERQLVMNDVIGLSESLQ